MASARTAAAAPVPENVSTVNAAIGTLSRIRPDARLHINAVPRADAGSSRIEHVWVAGELSLSNAEASAAGTVADVEVSGGGVVGTAHVELAPLQRGFLTDVSLPAPLDGMTVDVRVRVSGPGVARTADSVTAEVTAGLPRPLVFRRGPSSGNRLQPAASFLFSRTERVHLEVPIDAGWTPGPARLLDKTGQPIAVPVATGERTDADSGQRWLTADVTLAPLAPGDYAIEVTAAPGGRAAFGDRDSVGAMRAALAGIESSHRFRVVRGRGYGTTERRPGRSAAGPPARERLRAVLTSDTCVKAWGKLPSRRRVSGSYSSDSRPRSLRRPSSRVKIARASSSRPWSA